MNKLLISLALSLMVSIPVFGQDWDREEQDPVATELWAPVPPKVTPGDAMTPPSDAIILFDGTGNLQWQKAGLGGPIEWVLDEKEGSMTVNGTGSIETKQGFGSVQLHIEFRTPTELVGEGQGRGNSGVFFMGMYEVQILDSYTSDTYANGQAGSIYKQYPPLVNATKAPGEWQAYDIIFMAPVFGENGRMIRPATITAFHNGVLIQNNSVLLGPSQYKGQAVYMPHPERLPLQLQDHGNPISFRNIWVREL